ncbi:hypothetical protein H2248_006830 [Termitomyces sp. 'cryptogamus']|nr:hypothetical protein H2248_006830 [Termitomyces sp. 'cryptogamus']
MHSKKPIEIAFREEKSKLYNIIASSAPKTSSMCLGNIETDPIQHSKQFDNLINHAIDHIKRIFDGDILVIDPWIPNITDNALLDHYKAVKIPTLHGKPCLLHELGKYHGTPLNRHKNANMEKWPDCEERIQSIFLGPQDMKLHSQAFNA